MEVPTKSGDWTIESIAGDVRPVTQRMLERLLDNPVVQEDGTSGVHADWRGLRHEVWRQTGALCDEDFERLFDGPRDALRDAITETVARSWIQQRERMYDLCDGRLGEIVDEHCPPNTPSDDWNLDACEAALREQFNFAIEVPRKGA